MQFTLTVTITKLGCGLYLLQRYIHKGKSSEKTRIRALETFSIRFFMGIRKLQFKVARLQFHLGLISIFSKVFIS